MLRSETESADSSFWLRRLFGLLTVRCLYDPRGPRILRRQTHWVSYVTGLDPPLTNQGPRIRTLRTFLGWEKTTWRNLERIVTIRQSDEERCLGREAYRVTRFVVLPLLGFCLLCLPSGLLAQERSLPAIMPLPAHVVPREGEFVIDGSFGIALKGYREPRLERAQQRFLALLSKETGHPALARSNPQPAALHHSNCGAECRDPAAWRGRILPPVGLNH